jgi:hypothetical protein
MKGEDGISEGPHFEAAMLQVAVVLSKAILYYKLPFSSEQDVRESSLGILIHIL